MCGCGDGLHLTGVPAGGGGAPATLQSAYDNGEIIVITAADGPTEIITPGGAPGDVPLLLSSTSAGATGVIFEIFHNSPSPATGDVAGRIRFTGRDSGGGKDTYGELEVIIVETAGAESGTWIMRAARLGTLARILQITGTHAAADAGVIFTNDTAANATNPAFTFRAGDNWGSLQFVVRVQDNNTFNLFTIDGDGTAVISSPLLANLGARLELFQDSTSPAINDVVGRINFRGRDTGLNLQDYAFIDGMILEPASLASGGKMEFSIMNAETMALVLRIMTDGGAAAGARGVVFENTLAASASASQFEFRLTENSATVGPIVSIFRNRTNDAVDNDLIGALAFDGMDDSTPIRVRYGRMNGFIRDSGVGSEDFSFEYHAMQAGTLARILEVRPDGGAAGADRGLIFKNYIAGGAVAAFEMRANGNFGAGQGVFVVTNNNTGNVPFQVDGDGDAVVQQDIEAVGGYKSELGHWVRTDVTIPVTDEVMSLFTSGNLYTIKQTTYSGSIVGMSIRLSVAVDAGDTLTIDVTLDGAKVFSTTMVAADGTEKTVTQAKDIDTFILNQSIGVLYSTNAGFGPAGLDFQVQVIVEQ